MTKRNAPKGTSPMNAALHFLSARPRSVREVEDKLDSLNFSEGDIGMTVARLKEIGLLNDEALAAEFVATRLSSKPLSRRKLREQLLAHRLAGDIVEQALGTVDDAAEAANALAIAEKYARQFAVLDADERKHRVMRRLVGRGFEYNASRAALEQLFGDAQGLETCKEDEDDED